MLAIGDRALHKVSFSTDSARVVNNEFYPGYNQQSLIDFQDVSRAARPSACVPACVRIPR